MLFPLIELGGLVFWIFFSVLTIIATCIIGATRDEKDNGLPLVFYVITIAILFAFVGNTNGAEMVRISWGTVWEAIRSSTYHIGVYFLIGIIWTTIRWWVESREDLKRHLDDRKRYFIRKGIESGEVPTPDDPNYHLKVQYVFETLLENDKLPKYRAHYSIRDVESVWKNDHSSRITWADYLKEQLPSDWEDKLLPSITAVWVTNTAALWPLSLLELTCRDFLTFIFGKLTYLLKDVYKAIARLTYKKAIDELR